MPQRLETQGLVFAEGLWPQGPQQHTRKAAVAFQNISALIKMKN